MGAVERHLQVSFGSDYIRSLVWSFTYRRHGKARRLTLGEYPGGWARRGDGGCSSHYTQTAMAERHIDCTSGCGRNAGSERAESTYSEDWPASGAGGL